MSARKSRTAERRKAWGRGPAVLRFEPLEERKLLSTTAAAAAAADASTAQTATTNAVASATTTATATPDVVQTSLTIPQTLDWGDTFTVSGSIQNNGTGPTNDLARVDIYASTGSTVGPGAVELGTITIPNGLQPGQTYSYNQTMQLPINPLPGTNANQIWLSARIDQGNGSGPDLTTAPLGQGIDSSMVTIAPQLLANLTPTLFAASPNQTVWGSGVTVTAQITNNGQGNAPATQASIILTPAGDSPGSGTDVTIGTINVPAIPAGQSVTLQQTITLPEGPPVLLGSSTTAFTISIVPDTGYVTNAWYPHFPTQGMGYDQASLYIGPGANSTLAQGALPELEIPSVQAPSLPISWGQPFQVTTTIQNAGKADAGAFNVVFALVDSTVNSSQGIYLGSATINSLKAGYSQQLIQTLTLPTHLPDGSIPPSLTQGQIVVLADPQHIINQSSVAKSTGGSGTVTLTTLPPSELQSALAALNPTTTTTTTTTTPTPETRAQKLLAIEEQRQKMMLARYEEALLRTKRITELRVYRPDLAQRLAYERVIRRR
jgi:hypothetical protein